MPGSLCFQCRIPTHRVKSVEFFGDSKITTTTVRQNCFGISSVNSLQDLINVSRGRTTTGIQIKCISAIGENKRIQISRRCTACRTTLFAFPPPPVRRPSGVDSTVRVPAHFQLLSVEAGIAVINIVPSSSPASSTKPSGAFELIEIDGHYIPVIVDIQDSCTVCGNRFLRIAATVVEAGKVLVLICTANSHRISGVCAEGVGGFIVIGFFRIRSRVKIVDGLFPDCNGILSLRRSELGIKCNISRQRMIPLERRGAGLVLIPSIESITHPFGRGCVFRGQNVGSKILTGRHILCTLGQYKGNGMRLLKYRVKDYVRFQIFNAAVCRVLRNGSVFGFRPARKLGRAGGCGSSDTAPGSRLSGRYGNLRNTGIAIGIHKADGNQLCKRRLQRIACIHSNRNRFGEVKCFSVQHPADKPIAFLHGIHRLHQLFAIQKNLAGSGRIGSAQDKCEGRSVLILKIVGCAGCFFVGNNDLLRSSVIQKFRRKVIDIQRQSIGRKRQNRGAVLLRNDILGIGIDRSCAAYSRQNYICAGLSGNRQRIDQSRVTLGALHDPPGNSISCLSNLNRRVRRCLGGLLRVFRGGLGGFGLPGRRVRHCLGGLGGGHVDDPGLHGAVRGIGHGGRALGHAVDGGVQGIALGGGDGGSGEVIAVPTAALGKARGQNDGMVHGHTPIRKLLIGRQGRLRRGSFHR